MDRYTAETRSWLDRRFRATDRNGIYIGHQPIYGFRVQPCEPGLLSRYIITYQVLRALTRISFRTFLDVGGAEGYKAALVARAFGAKAFTSDLSEEANRRARDLYAVAGFATDTTRLPLRDRSVDVVLCSECLEHVSDLEGATRELLRVARHAVVITVPREPPEVVAYNIAHKVPHGHIHALTPESFAFVAQDGWHVESVSLFIADALKLLNKIVDGRPSGEDKARYPKWMTIPYTLLGPFIRFALPARILPLLVRLDQGLAEKTGRFGGMCFILLRNTGALQQQVRTMGVRSIVEFRVPPLRLRAS